MWFFIVVVLLLSLFWNLFLPLFVRTIVGLAIVICLIVFLMKAVIAFIRWIKAMSGGNIVKALVGIFAVWLVAALLLIIPVVVGRIIYF